MKNELEKWLTEQMERGKEKNDEPHIPPKSKKPLTAMLRAFFVPIRAIILVYGSSGILGGKAKKAFFCGSF